MHFPRVLLTALGAAAVVVSAVVLPRGQSPTACQSSLKANEHLEEKAASRDQPFLTSKSHSTFLPTPCIFCAHRNTSLTITIPSEFVVNGTGVPEVDFDLGESYAGRLPIAAPDSLNGSSENELFFWFFPSKNPAASNEITIWLNGGPGCSSMGGLLQENGPFLWQPGTYSPQPNPFSWTNLTNMVWIDQPIGKPFPSIPFWSKAMSHNDPPSKVWQLTSNRAGTGLSSAAPGDALLMKNEHDVAAHFAGFWKNFIDTFDMHGYDVYLAGESYAGMFVPYIANHFLEQEDDEYYNVKGIQINDPAIGPLPVMEHAPSVQYLNKYSSYFNLNESFTRQMNERAEGCGYTAYMAEALMFPPKGPFAFPHSVNVTNVIDDNCKLWLDIARAAIYVNPCFDPYHISSYCPFPSNPLGFPTLGWGPNNYFNRSDVKDALNVPDADFAMCRMRIHGLETSEPASFSVLPSVIERTGNVVIANGELDFLIPPNGTLAVINNMTWQGIQGFEESPFTDRFFVPYNPTIEPALEEALKQNHIPTLSVGIVGGGGWYGKTHTERGLTFVTVELAGHEIPQYVPGAAYRQLEFLLGRVDNLTTVGEFTTAGSCNSV